tara:strand:- start:3396 stop:3638 length:243 start_codon:yes stop_codon:yes gene_type:complete
MIEYVILGLLLIGLLGAWYMARQIQTIYREMDCVHGFVHDMEHIVALFEEYVVHIIAEEEEGEWSNQEDIRKWDLGASEE